MKKTIIIVVLATLLIGGVGATILFPKKTNEYVAQIRTETIEVQVDATAKAIQEAITASSTEIEATAKKAYDDAKRREEIKIELRIRDEIDAKNAEIKKQLQKEASF